MPFERWGSLSVSDHIDTEALAINVLLYDRLVIPVMSEEVQRIEGTERGYWVEHGWDPDLQQQRVDQLEELAVQRPWDNSRRAVFTSRIAELEAERLDTDALDDKGLTRRILAQEQIVERPPGVDGVTVVAAYNSLQALSEDFTVGEKSDEISKQAWLLGRQIHVPDFEDHSDTLREAIVLSRDEEFRGRRRDLFEWQDAAIAQGMSAEEAVARISDKTDAYNKLVRSAVKQTKVKFAFTVFGCAVGFATGGVGGAAASAALSLLGFALFDGKPAIDAGTAAPAAMFHDVESRLGMKL